MSAQYTGRGGLIERLQGEAMAALKGGDRRRAEALRLMVAALKYERTQGTRHDLSEQEEIAVLKRERKRRLEAAEVYEGAGRAEQAEQERYEEAIIASYLPEQLSDEELTRLVDEAIASTWGFFRQGDGQGDGRGDEGSRGTRRRRTRERSGAR